MKNINSEIVKMKKFEQAPLNSAQKIQYIYHAVKKIRAQLPEILQLNSLSENLYAFAF